MISKTRLICGKCGQLYLHEDNLGTLQCYDTLYTIDHNMSFKVKADHRPTVGKKKSSVYDWQDWVWNIDDCQFAEVNLLKKMTPQPNKLSIIVLEEFNNMYHDYIEGTIKEDAETSKTSTQLIVYTGSSQQQTLSDDEYIDFDYDSYDEEIVQQEAEDAAGYENMYISEGIIKEVCIARFDWREKFNVLSKIKRIDNQIEIRDRRPVVSVPYYKTLEFKRNPQLRRMFFDKFV